MKKVFLALVIFMLLFPALSQAANKYVSPLGAAAWGDCTNVTTPADSASNCSLYTANQNADDDDIVYLRAGDYYIGASNATGNGHDSDALSPGIIPINSGSAGHVITYMPYSTETVNFIGSADTGVASFGIWINAKSYIKVTGTSLGQLNLTKMKANLVIGPASGTNPTGNSEYNEISYVYINNSYGAESWTNYWQGSVVWKSANYNHIHHCKFEKHGFQAFPVNQCTGSGTPNACCTAEDEGATCGSSGIDNEGNLFDLGGETDATYGTKYNVIENNEFFHAGHATMGLFGSYNVIRNNYLHNEAWSNFGGTLYGYRNIITGGKVGYSGYDILEGNRIGYADENAQVGNQGGGGTKLASSYNMLRYNSYFGNKGMALYIGSYTGSDSGKYNYIYNNTFYYNGYYADPLTNVDPVVWQCGSTTSCWSTTLVGNALKNNLFYNNKKSPWYSWLYGGNYTLLSTYNTLANNYEAVFDPFVDTDLTDTTSWVLPNLNPEAGSAIINAASYLTTVHADDTGSGTSLIVTDARYFQDGNFGGAAITWPASATIAADYICVGATLAAAECMQISAVDYATNTLTVANFTREDGDKVWLYKKSDGVQVLYGTAPDYGAYEATQYLLTLTVNGTGTCTVSSSPSGINSTTSTTHYYYSGTVVTLTSTAAGGSTFAGWSGTGGCSGVSTCDITVDGTNDSATATCNVSGGGSTGAAAVGTTGSIGLSSSGTGSITIVP